MNDRTTAEQAAAGHPIRELPAQTTLVVHHGDTATVARLLPGASLIVGRQFPADITVDDPSLSRQHARFSVQEDRVRVEDLGSRNGTWVGGERVQQAALRSGEPVRLGGVTATAHTMVSGLETGAQAADETGPGGVVQSPRMRQVYERIAQVAPTTAPVLILGETGTGKEHVAHALHQCSDRSRQPLRVINCAAIPDGLAESLLFGHERGAFTGAHTSAQGLFEQADGGTIFLDEIGELSPANQAALLRTLESKTVLPVGSRRVVQVDVRIVAATHRDLRARVAEAAFREDLYYRLNTVTLQVPPLRERREEIGPLAEHFLSQASRAWGRPARTLSLQVRTQLEHHPWPGNIRQLRNAMEYATLVCRGDRIEVGDLPIELLDVHALDGDAAAVAGTRGAPTAPPERPASDGAFKDRVREFETQMIVDALRSTGGNQRAAARLLRIPLRTLAHKMKSHAIRERLESEVGAR